jgi:hypothetical protein
MVRERRRCLCCDSETFDHHIEICVLLILPSTYLLFPSVGKRGNPVHLNSGKFSPSDVEVEWDGLEYTEI